MKYPSFLSMFICLPLLSAAQDCRGVTLKLNVGSTTAEQVSLQLNNSASKAVWLGMEGTPGQPYLLKIELLENDGKTRWLGKQHHVPAAAIKKLGPNQSLSFSQVVPKYYVKRGRAIEKVPITKGKLRITVGYFERESEAKKLTEDLDPKHVCETTMIVDVPQK
jgi:hypothetical protein